MAERAWQARNLASHMNVVPVDLFASKTAGGCGCRAPKTRGDPPRLSGVASPIGLRLSTWWPGGGLSTALQTRSLCGTPPLRRLAAGSSDVFCVRVRGLMGACSGHGHLGRQAFGQALHTTGRRRRVGRRLRRWRRVSAVGPSWRFLRLRSLTWCSLGSGSPSTLTCAAGLCGQPRTRSLGSWVAPAHWPLTDKLRETLRCNVVVQDRSSFTAVLMWVIIQSLFRRGIIEEALLCRDPLRTWG